jgi:hypothetical protein
MFCSRPHNGWIRAEISGRPASRQVDASSGERAHEDEEDEILQPLVSHTMIFSGPRDHDLVRPQRAILAGDVEESVPLDHVVDLVRIRVAMDTLLLTGLQTIAIAEVVIGSEERYLAHLLVGKADRTHEIP